MLFEVTPQQIERLNDVDLRTLVGRMAEQEAIRQGFSPSGVTYGGHQLSPDGGIDVRVDLPGEVVGYIPRGKTGFQVKAEDFAKAAILKEMRPAGKLRSSIIDLAAESGAYVIVSSKGSVSDASLKARRKAMQDALVDLDGGKNLYVDFYDRQRIATWVNQNAGLIPWVRERVGFPLSGWQPFTDWSSSPGFEQEDFLTDAGVRLTGGALDGDRETGIIDGINHLREILSETHGAVRLVGLSGLGKTRLIQALFDERLGNNALPPYDAVYTDLADQPDPVPLELLTHIQSLGRPCVLIIDNCGLELHRKLIARLAKSNAPVSIVTVEYDISDDLPEHTKVFRLEPASNELIEGVLRRRYPKLSQPDVRTVAEFSEGNFRIALALAETAGKGESLANLNDRELFKRLFRQRNEDNPALLRAAQACSLVYSLEGENLKGADAELPVLASLAGQSAEELYGHIAELHRRQLVQKRSEWRAILPHALAHRLAKQALQDMPAQKVLDSFTVQAPTRLLKSFSRRLGFLHDSPEAQSIVASWLDEGGWLSDVSNLNDLGQILLDNVAPVIPSSVLECLERAARDGSLYTNATVNSQKIDLLLRSLAYDATYFERSINLIAGFADEGQRSNNSGDAISIFESLFMIYLSGTHAPPHTRAAVIRKFAQSGLEREAKLALAGLRSMLQTDHFTSSYGFDFGTRKRDYGYHPQGRKDVQNWYRTALGLASDLAKLPHLRTSVRELVARRFPRLLQQTGMIDELMALAKEFQSDGSWAEGWVGARAALRKLEGSERASEIEQVRNLIDELKPQTLEERIAAYIKPRGWSTLDVVEADFASEDRRQAAEEAANVVARDIGRELSESIDLLRRHLPTLIRAESYRLPIVIKSLAEHTPNISEAWYLIRDLTIKESDGAVFNIASMFTEGVSKRDRSTCEVILDETLSDERLHGTFISMQCRAGLNDVGVGRVLKAIDLPSVPIESFNHLAYQTDWEESSSSDFARILQAVANRENGVPIAFEIMDGRIHDRRSKKVGLNSIEKSAGRSLLIDAGFERENHVRRRHLFARIAEACFDASSPEGMVKQLCINVREAIDSHRISAHDLRDLIVVLAERFPMIVMDELVDPVSSDDEAAGISGTHRLARLNPVSKIDPAIVMEWASKNPERRQHSLAHIIPLWEGVHDRRKDDTEFEDSAGPVRWTEIARILLDAAYDKVAIFRILLRRFHPMGWSGSLAAILESRLPLLDELSQSPDPAIAAAAKEAIPEFREAIASARDWEARQDRSRDERFEW